MGAGETVQGLACQRAGHPQGTRHVAAVAVFLGIPQGVLDLAGDAPLPGGLGIESGCDAELQAPLT
ncbi:hypothetical protein Pure05_09690 [Paenarthrobacter ureafaciens]|nr:hypothetical protein Pure01_04140 [Paenarthrobacter ureafaciens]GLU62722.1 hypothetical protein Pure02_09720 [Paenarthrobacter ureafaciens]GLU70908.1 hypothetical protein Pure04_06230 [Paenarthrobacter ureafaciens]GLU75529.1 hypothetical protein Pure05_09690 [Paenarthrobacter ureafaciens]